jgi:hypothetical protein
LFIWTGSSGLALTFSLEIAVRGRRGKLLLPLEDAGACGCGFGLGNVAGVLERDGKRCVGERVRGRERGEAQRDTDGLFELAAVAEGADETVMSLDVFAVKIDGRAEEARGGGGVARGKRVDAVLAERVGSRGCAGGFHGLA